MAQEKEKRIIGRAEKLSFPELGLVDIHARIDTGAKTSSIWTSYIEEREGVLLVTFFGKPSPYFTDEPVAFEQFDRTVVATSTGHTQTRYKVRLLVKLRGKKVRAWFTLADRSTQVYPVLIGRNVLLGKFIGDVKKGKSLKEEERERTKRLRSELEEQE
ncbi:MAG TPA: RimK/LysX family protein [Candidatus Saccharimonadales bacterium]|nr:RimK/LysX family protein [Candidatus Saccharimonadales bacterium]